MQPLLSDDGDESAVILQARVAERTTETAPEIVPGFPLIGEDCWRVCKSVGAKMNHLKMNHLTGRLYCQWIADVASVIFGSKQNYPL